MKDHRVGPGRAAEDGDWPVPSDLGRTGVRNENVRAAAYLPSRASIRSAPARTLSPVFLSVHENWHLEATPRGGLRLLLETIYNPMPPPNTEGRDRRAL